MLQNTTTTTNLKTASLEKKNNVSYIDIFIKKKLNIKQLLFIPIIFFF